jgi:hypothetical protein
LGIYIDKDDNRTEKPKENHDDEWDWVGGNTKHCTQQVVWRQAGRAPTEILCGLSTLYPAQTS